MPSAYRSAAKSLQERRPSRVNIFYELDTNGAKREVELPFVMGVMADLSGNASAAPQDEDPTFVPVTFNTFDSFMQKTAPGLALQIESTLPTAQDNHEEGNPLLNVNLKFESLRDFSPEKVAEQVPALQEMLTLRNYLVSLKTRADGDREAEKTLLKLFKNPGLLQELAHSSLPEAQMPA